MELVKRENSLGEVMYSAKHGSGLEIFIVPRKNYTTGYALFGTNYGSVDSEFIVPGEDKVTKVPDGIAHYLEHKMFEQPDGGNVFAEFSKYGANANAYTSFNITAYLFSAADNFKENLQTLMDYVQKPYFTPENVQKERGIIGQEIGMNDDQGEWKVLFNFLNCIYQKNPVKKEIAGTVESISHITDELLYKCYNTFYNLSNMAIVVTGDFDPKEIAEVIEKGIIKNDPFDEEIKRIYDEEPDEIAAPYKEQAMSVAMPLFMLGFKDTDLCSGEMLQKKYIEMNILMKMLFGKSSSIYRRLYDLGIINDSFSPDYTCRPDYGFSSVDGESENPKQVYDIIIEEIEKLRKSGLSRESYERAKKAVWGDYVRSYNSTEAFANNFLQMHFMGGDYFAYEDVYKAIGFADVEKRFMQHFVPERSALSVVTPSDRG